MKKVAVLMMSLLCAMSVMAVDKSDVAAPVIEPNEMGFIILKDCPVKAPHVSTFVYDNEDGSMRAKVYVARSLVLWYDDLDVSGAERNPLEPREYRGADHKHKSEMYVKRCEYQGREENRKSGCV
ncbi:MAG: hypothetical protein IIT60_00725, partial [Muribaculaceae bacterium]|nr:hypothetical protein [Muribaculaceae bacterium]